MYKVLLVDDEYMVLVGLQKLIDWESLSLEVVGTAKSGAEALAFLATHEVDIVISDVHMPLMTGLEFLQAAKEANHAFESIILSGFQEFAYAQKGMELGAINYLLKPVDKAALQRELTKMVHKLDEKQESQKQHHFLHQSVVEKWIQGSFSEQELAEWGKLLDQNLHQGHFEVILYQVKNKQFSRFFLEALEQCQGLFLANATKEAGTLVFVGEQAVGEFALIQQEFEQHVNFFSGSYTRDGSRVPLCYQEALEKRSVFQFYGGSKKIPGDAEEIDKEIGQFLNALLLLKDFQQLKKKTDELFTCFHKYKILPETVKQHATVIVLYGYLQFQEMEEELYQQSLFQIQQADTLLELKEQVFQLLDEMNAQQDQLAYSPVVLQVVDIVHESFNEDLNLKSIAKSLHVNVMYLGQLFIKETGMTFSKYLNQFRIQLAQGLLLHSKDSINEIAVKVGYANPSYFYKNFRKNVGISPKEFREKGLKNSLNS